MTRVIQIGKFKDTPTRVTIFKRCGYDWSIIKDFTPTKEWMSGLRNHLMFSKTWAFVPVFWASDRALEIEFEYTGGKND